MITFNNIVERFKIFAENHFFIETFSFGSPDDVDLTKFTSFPLMHLVYTGATYDAGTKTYNLEVYILDVPADKEQKTDRQKEVVSDAEQCAEDIIADIKNGGNIFLFAQDYEVVNATTTPLEEETKNVLSGVLLDLSVAIPYEWDACNAPIDGVEPGGTEVTYARRGVLRMLTLDGATDVPSVRTIKVTNGTLTDDGDGVVTLDTGGVDTLAGLTDVDVTGVTDGQVLKYDDATGEWIPANDQSATSLGNLDDVSITTPADREALIYDGGNWVNDNISKTDVGLGNVDNTSDADKPVSSATQTALDAKADTSAVPTELNDLSDVTIAGTPAGNEALIYDTATSSFKSLPNFTNRFEDEAENNKQSILPFAERVYTVKADGDGIFIEAQSDTPTAGKVIVRKIYQKAGFLESGAVIGDFTLIHTFADDTAYSATTSTFEGFRDGDTYGTPPFTLIQTWEEQTAAPTFTGLLNETYGSGAAAAFGTRRLNGNYSGACMTIRRASDGTTTTIGFDGEDIDEAAIETFCTGTTCTVQVWHDQSQSGGTGSGNDATQTNPPNQPTIYTGGQLVKQGGRLALDFAIDRLDVSFTSKTLTSQSTFVIAAHSSGGNFGRIFTQQKTGANSDTAGYIPLLMNGTSESVGSFLNVGMRSTLDIIYDNAFLFSSINSGTALTNYVDGTAGSSYSHSYSESIDRYALGAKPNSLSNTMDGLIQEAIVYDSDKSTDRTDIEGNISAYYQSAKLLNESYGSGAAAAYSVRQLNRDYTGAALQVERSSDNTTQDIGFDSNGDLDESALTTFCTGTTCRVRTWYDQATAGGTGSGNDAVQTVHANQPTIYTGGALVKEGGRLALQFDGSDDFLDSALTISTTNIAVSTVQKFENVAGGQVSTTISRKPNEQLYVLWNNTLGNWDLHYRGVTSTVSADTNQNLISFYTDTTNAQFYQNSASIGSSFTKGAISSFDPIRIGAFSTGSNETQVDYQELIIWQSDKSTDRTSIESNVGDYFTQNTPLLDTYTGAAAAYSLRKLRSAYSGSAIRVRRASDNAETDIGFNVFGELDTVSLAAHCGSNDGFVKTWYDQSGNTNDATQTNTANQGKIYDSTTGVLTANGKPYVDCSTAIYYNPTTVAQPYTAFAVTELTGNFQRVIGGFPDWSPSTNMRFNAGTTLTGSLTVTYSQLQLFTALANGSSSEMWYDGDADASGNAGTNSFTTGGTIFTRSSASNGTPKAYELIVYGSDQSSNRTNIEDNINTFYSIY